MDASGDSVKLGPLLRRAKLRRAPASCELGISGEKYGYVVNAVMACLLRGVEPSKAALIVGVHFPVTDEQNDLRAFTANPFIPDFCRA
jgi:hypothetical protein